MKIKHIYIGLGIFILSILSIYSYKYSNDKSTNEVQNKVSINKTADELPKQSFADWKNNFHSEDEIIKAADLIIMGNVINSYTEKRKSIVITKYVIKANKIFKGDIDQKQEIELLQTGGQIEDLITYPIEGSPTINKNQSYLFLLERTNEGHYLILGGYQGIGKINNNKLIFDKNTRISYSKLDNNNVSEINQNINGIIK